MTALVDVLIQGKYAAQQAFASFRDDMNSAVDKARGATEGFMDIKAGFDIAAGAIESAAQIVGQAFDETVNKSVAYAKQVRELSTTIGASAEETSKLIQAADDTQVSYQSLTSALEAAIRKGVVPSIDGIARLAEQYNSIQNPIERTRFLMDTFGKSGADLAPLMAQGAAGIRDLGQAAADAGLVIDQEAIAAARRYEIALDDLQDKFEAQKIQIGNTVIPALADLIETQNRVDAAVKEDGTSWLKFTGMLGGAVQAFYVVREAMKLSEEQTKKTGDEFAEAEKKLRSFNATANQVPIVGHGKSYKAGQGPAYPYSESNPEGYVMDPQTGAKSYPGRATGGPVVGGVPYLVGERGPEIFVPRSNGVISTGGGGGSGGDITLNLTLQSLVGIQDQMEAERVLYPVMEQAMRRMKRNGQV
jgi:uncharacterized phage infection (PIP) family protein YhgE